MMSLPRSSSEGGSGFDLLHPQIQRWVRQQGWSRLRDVQEQAIAAICGRDEDVLIVGSGMSFHNMQGFFTGMSAQGATLFDEWLAQTVQQPGDVRRERLLAWQHAPGATISHPPGGEDHFLPLMIAAGASRGDAGSITATGPINANPVSGIVFNAREECSA